MERYLTACGGDTRKAMTLYRYNLQISQEMFTIVSCFEVALRNAIDRKLTEDLGAEWLKMQYNQTYMFNELDKVNSLRNRIAHHETICFATNTSTIDTSYVINIYTKIKTLFSWMDIDSNSLLYGLDHITRVCAQINKLKAGICPH